MTLDLELPISLARRIAHRYAALATVRAAALGGSMATGYATPDSDIDLYVCLTGGEVPPRERARIVSEDTDPAAIRNDYWGPGDEWIDTDTGIHVDVIFWDTEWIEEQVRRVLVRHEASVGYTTCFWHTIRHARPLYDRDGWLEALQAQAMQPYPEPLVRNIVARNYPILRNTGSAYLCQLEKATFRRDLVSANHRVAALLASYFDILFAANRLPHPGEKRLLTYAEEQCKRKPADLRGDVEGLVRAISDADHRLSARVHTLVDHLDDLLRADGLKIID
jgi:predicted nucleotidyltransferase